MHRPAGEIAPATGAATGGRRVVLFDFDGVLVRGDAFAKFLRAHYARAWWRALPLLLMSPLLLVLAATARGRRAVVRLTVGMALLGLGEARYRALASAFGRTLARDARNFSRGAFSALNGHRHAGDRVLVVTGCEETLARTILDELGLAAIELVASRLERGRCGLRAAVHNIGAEKPRQLAQRGLVAPWDIAYSDSLVDLPLLAAAQAAVLVNPRRGLLARAKARLGERVTSVDWY